MTVRPAFLLKSGVQDRFFMLVSTMVRLLVGLTVLVILARGLGPTKYGLIATVMAYGYVAAVLTDFGLSTKTLRDIAADRGHADEILFSALDLKMVLSVIVGVAGAAAITLTPTDLVTKLCAALIGAGVMIASIGDLTMVGYRAVGRYGDEARFVLVTSLAHGLALSAAAFLWPSALLVSVIFFVSRSIYTGLAILQAKRLFPSGQGRPSRSIRQTLGGLREAGWWAADNGMGYVASQIDGPIIAAVFGLSAAGLYQGAARFVQASLAAAVVLTNIHIPRLASAASGGPRFREEWRMFAEFTLVGAGLAVFFVVGGPYLTHFLLGDAFAKVDELWPGFAAFVFGRYVAAAFGMSLSAHAQPAMRVAAQVGGLAALAGGFWWGLPRYGLVAGPWTLAAASAVTGIIYAGAYVRLALGGRRDGHS